MSRKTDSASSRGFDDVIGVVLMLAAILLLLAQLSFDRHDIGYLSPPAAHPAHNGGSGRSRAYIAWWLFCILGAAAYCLPFLLAVCLARPICSGSYRICVSV